MGCFGCLGKRRGSRTNDVFPRRLLPRDIQIFSAGTRLEKLVFLIRMQHCFLDVELLERGVAVFDEPVGSVPGGEGGAAGAAAVARSGGRGDGGVLGGCRGEVWGGWGGW